MSLDILYQLLFAYFIAIETKIKDWTHNLQASLYIWLHVVVVEGDQKAPFSIATSPMCRGGRYSFPKGGNFSIHKPTV